MATTLSISRKSSTAPAVAVARARRRRAGGNGALPTRRAGVIPEVTGPDVCEVELIHPEVVRRVRAALPGREVTQRVAALFAILSDPTRARIVAALAEAELCVCDVAAVALLSVSAASHQLKRLRDQNVVSHRKDGRLAYYRLSDAHIGKLVADGIERASGAGRR